MAQRHYNAEAVFGMISDDSDMNEEERDFYDTDLEISDDEDDDNSESMDIDDVDAATGSKTDSNGWRERLPSDNALLLRKIVEPLCGLYHNRSWDSFKIS